jgi:hypothetical protein
MLRSEVIQSVINLFDNPKYLEIGVDQGVTFHALAAAQKVAVDPNFRFDIEKARLSQKNNSYFQVRSDEFFEKFAHKFDLFDVIFLDGLHTFEQTLRDLMNATGYLNRNGVILIDDVRPISYSSSLKDETQALMVKQTLPQEADGAWMGDVYRLLYFIEAFMPSYTYATINENYSHQMIMWRQQRTDVNGFERTVESVARLDFASVLASEDAYRSKPLKEIIQAIKTAI